MSPKMAFETPETAGELKRTVENSILTWYYEYSHF
jgi:hypothetical protein